jgi:hypothetical protein
MLTREVCDALVCMCPQHHHCSDCERVDDAALHALQATSAATVRLRNCCRVTEAGVEALALACPSIECMDVTGCESISRLFMARLCQV